MSAVSVKQFQVSVDRGTYGSAGTVAPVFFMVPHRAVIHTNESLEMFSVKVTAFIQTP
jgi:hypothetical protein